MAKVSLLFLRNGVHLFVSNTTRKRLLPGFAGTGNVRYGRNKREANLGRFVKFTTAIYRHDLIARPGPTQHWDLAQSGVKSAAIQQQVLTDDESR